MARIIGISGSLRQASFNTALLRVAATLMPTGSPLEIHSIRGIPLYDGDVEAAQGIPPPVSAIKEALSASEGLLLSTPEYNNSLPGVLKNAIDWLSRPPGDIKRVFGGKAVALMGATPGPWGTLLSQTAWLPVFRTLGARLWSGGRLAVPNAGKVFDPSGAITDEKIREHLGRFLGDFVAFASGRAS
jgi:NAD(P)H-dependent FMN reductase